MNEFFERQFRVLRRLIDDYRAGVLSLNTLIQRIQAIGDVLDLKEWKESVFPIICSMEQINAFSLEAKQDLTVAERDSIRNSLLELASMIERFDPMK